jgi:rfaE bifunctional protein nucleotidyltransferase chain/domain
LNKYFPLPDLAPLIQAEKAKGRSIVLANGCFDLIHVGHIRYLKGAKEQGDVLVVALNSDASVRGLKGPGRPILDQSERLEIIAAFEFVDFVTLFEEDKVDRVLLELKPHIHVKGSDYTEETVPEKDTVRDYGGRVAIAGGPKVRNTSDLIQEIAAKIQDE